MALVGQPTLTARDEGRHVSLLAWLIYRALVWKEKKRTQLGQEPPPSRRGVEAADTGERGETLAYWYLRQCGYTIVARNRRANSSGGEVDLIGWDGPVLAFIEVKTRTSLAAGEPETAVTGLKRQRMVRAARDYLHRQRLHKVNYRFDIVSLYRDPEEGLKVRLIKEAFKS